MKCIKPIGIQDKTTGGILMVPCGRCISCRVQKSRMWGLRIYHEAMKHEKRCFVTLTYSDDKLPWCGSICRRHVQLFLKRLRKNSGVKIRYFLGGEYGEQFKRPHYHLVLCGLSELDEGIIQTSWDRGFVSCFPVIPERCNYVAGYVIKKLSGPAAIEYCRRGVAPEFALMSRRPGIGAGFADENSGFLRQNQFSVVKGQKVPLPRFYVERLFSEEDKKIRHERAQKFYDEHKEVLRQRSGLKQDYQINEYERDCRRQAAIDLEKNQEMHRRKL